MFYFDCLIASFFGIFIFPNIVAARFCEGGHICSLPRECCTQGCCPPYQNGPRQLPPATDHVLNLFFINHWYFWFLIVAIVLALLCIYSLWKKRRTLCGWNFPEHHTQSEGDSAGSCYAPPQYSRCNSFHHPPPPYTEVTSKPDLYPLVFTCNSDNGKTGASYLMVQYFRNYIVRPAGSLSATSTVDSLSSSFICNANEANTLVPPPYSRAASPEIGINSHYQHHYMIPRSASQVVCSDETAGAQNRTRNLTPLICQTNSQNYEYGVVSEYDGNTNNTRGIILNQNPEMHPLSQMRISESVNFQNIDLDSNISERPNTFLTSQSDQQFRYIENSNSSISDIFVNNSCNGIGGNGTGVIGNCLEQNNTNNNGHQAQNNIIKNNLTNTNNISSGILYSNTSNSISNSNNQIPNNSTNSTNNQFIQNNKNPVYNSCGSIGGISITVPVATDGDSSYQDLNVLRRSLETCCQILKQQQQMPSASFSEDSTNAINMTKKFDNNEMRSFDYVTSTTCSAVSSLANIGSPISPPQATSPTDEVKEILDQIRQLQNDNSHHIRTTNEQQLPQQQIPNSPGASCSKGTINTQLAPTKRPSTLSHSTAKKKFFSKTNKTLYTPMTCSASVRNSIKSPVLSATSFLNRGRKGWISRSAPTTPGTGLPPNRLGDDSPLLNEHDEDQDQDHDSVQNV